MRFVIFLAIAVAAVASLPLDGKSSFVPESEVVNDADLAKIRGHLEIKIRDENGVWRRIFPFGKGTKDKKKEEGSKKEAYAGEFSLANLSPAELAKTKLKIRSEVNLEMKFSNPAAMKEGGIQLAQGTDSDLMRAIVKVTEEDIIHLNNGNIRLSDEKIREIVAEVLKEFGINDGKNNGCGIRKYIAPLEVEEIEIVPPPEYEGKAVNLADLPPTELAKFKIRIKGKINIGIKFINPDAMEGVESTQYLEPDQQEEAAIAWRDSDIPLYEEIMGTDYKLKLKGNLNIHLKFSNLDGMENTKYQLGDIMRFDEEKLKSFEVKSVEISST